MNTIKLELNIGEIFINSRDGYAVIIVEGESAKTVKNALESHEWTTDTESESSSSESTETPTTQASTK